VVLKIKQLAVRDAFGLEPESVSNAQELNYCNTMSLPEMGNSWSRPKSVS
jgi:hypothetical protein